MSTESKIAERWSVISGISKAAGYVKPFLSAYRYLLINNPLLSRFDPRSAKNRDLVTALSKRVGSSYQDAFTFGSILYSLAQSGEIPRSDWDPAGSREVAQWSIKTIIGDILKPVGDVAAPVLKPLANVGRGLVIAGVSAAIIAGAIALRKVSK